MREAQLTDVTIVVGLMGEFYSESGYALDCVHAQAAFEELLSDARLGRVWIIDHDSVGVGYVVVTFVFAMEYGGLVAFVDDLFVRPAFRGAGLGTAALTAARDMCSVLGMRSMFVEVAGDNHPAQRAYSRVGFEMTERRLMVLPLAAATHQEKSSAHV